jgi:hypothetical protein
VVFAAYDPQRPEGSNIHWTGRAREDNRTGVLRMIPPHAMRPAAERGANGASFKGAH